MITLGIDLGGTKIAAAVVEEGRIVQQDRRPTPRTGWVDVRDAMVAMAQDLLKDTDAAAIGVGSPGPLDFDEGKVLFAPNIPGLENVHLVQELTERLDRPVYLENDANAAGFAEHRYGAARGYASSAYVTLSTGIGGGLFIGNTIVRGAHGVAGEIGHMTLLPGGPVGGDGHDGTWEALAAGRSIARDASYVFGQEVPTEELFKRASSGDRKAERILSNATRMTGIGLANLVKVFDPAVFVLGGGMASDSAYRSRVEANMHAYLEGWPVPVVKPASLGADVGVIGAASVAEMEFNQA